MLQERRQTYHHGYHRTTALLHRPTDPRGHFRHRGRLCELWLVQDAQRIPLHLCHNVLLLLPPTERSTLAMDAVPRHAVRCRAVP